MGKSRIEPLVMMAVCLAGLGVLCIFSKAALAGAAEGLKLFASIVLPSLLPYMVITGVLQRIGAEPLIGRPLEGAMRRLFRCGSGAAGTFLLASLSGYPVGARLIGARCASGELGEGEAGRMAAFCLNSGPSFIVVSVGAGMLGDIGMGWRLYAAHIAGALINGILFSRTGGEAGKGRISQPASSRGMAAFFSSVDGAAKALLAVGVTIAFFSSIIGISEESGVMALLNRAVETMFMRAGISEHLSVAFSAGLLEMTSGCSRAAAGAAPVAQRAALCSFLISLGGLSIMAQSLYFLGGAVKKRLFFLQRITHALISCALAWILALL